MQVPKPVAVTVKLNVPLTDGVPDNNPVAVFSVIPLGKLPAVTAKLYVPAGLAARVWL